MKSTLIFCTLFAITLAQTTTNACALFATRDVCANTAGRCQWLTGRNCAGLEYGFCADNAPCASQPICARKTPLGIASVPFSFPSTCIPTDFERVDPTLCVCTTPNNTQPCTQACTQCQTCVNGACVPAPSVVQCSVDRPCPNGQRCDSTTRPCNSFCVPVCTDAVVNCLVNPCSTPPPSGCPSDAICRPDYCGGCNRKYFDGNGTEICQLPCTNTECGPRPASPTVQCPDGSVGGNTGICRRLPGSTQCSWVIRECPNVCNDTLRNCPTVYCPYGYEYDVVTVATGLQVRCPSCRCAPAPNTTVCNVACTRITCPAGSQPYIPPGECCPKCSDPCASVRCPDLVCPTGFVYRIPDGECCGRCFPVVDCATVTCPPAPSAATPCPTGSVPVRRDCCVVCERQTPCSTVDCQKDSTTCPAGFKVVFRDGECCPRCEPRPVCDGVVCPALACASGEVATNSAPDLQCCPECRPINFCASVRCAKPNCSEDQWIRRVGQCCPQCPVCRDTTNTLCNPNDDTNCKAGSFTGPLCQDPVPSTQRKFKEITVKFCKRPECTPLDPQTIRILVSALSGVDSKYITVEVLGQASADPCCYRYKITIATDSSDPTNVDQATETVSNAIAANSSSGWGVETTTETSSGSVVAATCFAAAAAFALL